MYACRHISFGVRYECERSASHVRVAWPAFSFLWELPPSLDLETRLEVSLLKKKKGLKLKYGDVKVFNTQSRSARGPASTNVDMPHLIKDIIN